MSSGWTIGTAAAKTGTSAIDALGEPISALSGLAVAAAAIAIVVAVARHFVGPTDESLGKTLARVRRVLMLVAFLSVSGAFFSWIVTGTASESVPGISYIRGWF